MLGPLLAVVTATGPAHGADPVTSGGFAARGHFWVFGFDRVYLEVHG